MAEQQQLRAIVAAWWEDTFVNDYVIDRSGNYRSAEDCIEDIVIRARAAMRPKPLSLAEEALDVLNLMLMFLPPGDQREQGETIRAALKRQQELEGGGQ